MGKERKKMGEGKIEKGEVAALLCCIVLLPSQFSLLHSPISKAFFRVPRQFSGR